jgi:hypothetical protein
MAWLSRNDWPQYTARPDGNALNNLANDIRAWGGSVNAGGLNLSNLGVLTFGSGGYVGGPLKIGTTGSPVAKFDVDSSGGTQPTARFWHGGNDVGGGVQINVNWPVGSVTAFSVAGYAGAPLLNVTADGASGKVGIGTATPGAKLDVAGDGNFLANGVGTWDRVLSLANNNGAARVASGILRIVSSNNYSDNALIVAVGGSAPVYCLYSDGSFSYNSATANIMTGTTGGRVGIGTTAPAAPLHIKASTSYGSFRISPSVDNGESSIGFYSDAAGATTATAWVVGQGNWGNANDFIIGQNAAKVVVKNSSGRVGIGTTAPTAKLQVVGLATYANNAAAVAAGLTAGAFYIVAGDPAHLAIVT